MKWKRIWISLWLLTLLAIFIVTLINRTPYFLLGGSSSVAPVMEQLIHNYPDNHKEGDFNYASSASAGAPPRVANNIFGIGWLSEEYHVNKEKNPNLIDFQLMKDGLVIVYNLPKQYLKDPNAKLDFNTDILQNIYLNGYTWKDAFPNDVVVDYPVTTYTRPNGSGTRNVFDKMALNNQKYYQANTVDSSGAMLNLDSGSIGYSSYADFAQAAESQNLIVTDGKWNGEEANYNSINNNLYSLWRPFTGIINKNYKYKDEISKFLRWIYGSDPVVTDIFHTYGPRIELDDPINQELKEWLYPLN